jgi:hypothetical protein
LHANDCRVLVETVYGDLPKNEQKELYEELNKAVKEERDAHEDARRDMRVAVAFTAIA